jgi:vacuolar-type H+-ATPase subunit D/Vma8
VTIEAELHNLKDNMKSLEAVIEVLRAERDQLKERVRDLEADPTGLARCAVAVHECATHGKFRLDSDGLLRPLWLA